MNISVFGLGYVGTVTAACFARDGHRVIGVDANPEKIELVSRGVSPIVETGVDDLLQAGRRNGLIEATVDVGYAVENSEASLICVGTPPAADGTPDLSFVHGVCRELGAAVRKKQREHVVVIRSTVPPGTLKRCREIFEETAPSLIRSAFNPEFLREGSAVADYDRPPYTVIGTRDEAAERAVRAMYHKVDAPVHVVDPEVAELLKYTSNAWHAVKIGFANEIGRMARAFDVDGRTVMSLAVQDTKLNISPAYMRPGFAYGGSCLPKDVSALTALGRRMEVQLPLLNSLRVTNSVQIDNAVADVLATGAKCVAVFGLAFKPGTDDLRESPAVPLVKRLLGEGCSIKIYDRDVHAARLIGTNLQYIRSNLPHFEAMLVDSAPQALEGSDCAVMTYASREFSEALVKRPDLHVVDLAGQFASSPAYRSYRGSSW